MSTLFSLGMKAWISVFCLERCWQMPSILWCFSLLCSIGLRPLYVWSRSTILHHQWLLAAWFCDLVCSNWPCARAKWTPKKSQRNMWHLAKVLCWNHHFGHNTCCLDVYRQSGSTHTPILEFSLNWWKIQIINILIVRSCKTYSYIYIQYKNAYSYVSLSSLNHPFCAQPSIWGSLPGIDSINGYPEVGNSTLEASLRFFFVSRMFSLHFVECLESF